MRKFSKLKVAVFAMAGMLIWGNQAVLVVSAEESSQSEETTITIEDSTYLLREDGTASLTKYAGSDAKISVPASIEAEKKSYSVTEIGDDAFKMNKTLTEVEIPDSVTAIGDSAFYLCSGLSGIKIPDGVTTIGDYAFYKCTSLTTIDLPDKLESIGKYGFNACSELTGVEIPDGVTIMEGYMFSNCSNLTYIKLPNKVTEIGAYAFYQCSSLSAIEIPDSVTEICMGAFQSCTGLTEMNIPENVTTIGRYAFNNCRKLTIIEIPNNVTSVGNGAFENCVKLERIYYPGHLSVTKALITDAAWQISYTLNADGTLSLKVENIPEGKTQIQLPDSLNGKQVTSVQIDGTAVAIKHTHKSENKPTCSQGEVCTICQQEYVDLDNHINCERKNVKEATCIAEGYTGDLCCKDCGKQLEQGEITAKSTTHLWNEGVVTKTATGTKTGEKTYTCTLCGTTMNEEIPMLEAPANGTILQDSNASYKVTNRNLPDRTVQYVKSKKKNATTIAIPATVTVDGISYQVASIGDNAFINNKKVKKITIGKNIVTIGKNAFNGCQKLKTVTMGTNVKTIGDKAFYKCSALTKITIPSKVTKIGKQAFYNCKKLKSITIKTTKLKSSKIGSKAFAGTPEKVNVKVPKSKMTSYKKMLMKKGLSKNAQVKK